MEAEPVEIPSVADTSSPQASTANLGASDASPFQQSASADSLKQNTTLQVVSNGTPITVQPKSSGLNSSAVLFIVISSIVLVMLASAVFKWVMKRPEPVVQTELEEKLVVDEVPKAKKTANKPAKKKKAPRSKRHK